MWESEVNAGPSVGRRPETKPGCIFPTIFKSPAGKYRPSFHPHPQGVLDFLLLLSQDPGFLSSSCRARAARGQAAAAAAAAATVAAGAAAAAAVADHQPPAAPSVVAAGAVTAAAVDVASMSSAERRELLAKLGGFMGDE